MQLSQICIKRPVFATVINLVIIVLGILSYQRLAIQDYPPITKQAAFVTTYYEGASADLIEEKITTVIEDILSGTPGIDTIESNSMDNSSQISLSFDNEVDLDKTLNDIRDKLSIVRKRLPTEADSPVLASANNNSTQVMLVLFSDKNQSADWVSDYVKRNVEKTIQQVNGVGATYVYGGSDLALRITLNPDKMNAQNVTVDDINTALLNNHVSLPGGKISSQTHDYTVVTKSKLEDVNAFYTIPIKFNNGYNVKLQDVASVSLSPGDGGFSAWVNDEKAVIFNIQAATDGNLLDIARDVTEKLHQVRLNLPDTMDMRIPYDASKYIQASLDNVYSSIAEAVLLVVIVILLFIGSWRLAIIPIVAIPLCLFGALGLMYVLGFSINILSLLALVLAIGLVVDDAIVVVENIHRHMTDGLNRYQAAMKGSREIGFAVISMTCTLAAVYVPVGFTTGATGQLMREFSYTLAGTVIVSGFVALTLTPMMCAKLLNKETGHSAYGNVLEKVFERLNHYYQIALRWQLNHKLIFILVTVAFIAGGVKLLTDLRAEMAPNEDKGVIFAGIRTPDGANNTYFEKQLKLVASEIAKVPEAANRITMVFDNSGQAIVVLSPWDERERTQDEILAQLNAEFVKIPGADVYAGGLPPLPTGGRGRGSSSQSAGLSMVIQMNGTYTELNALMDDLKKELADEPGLENLQSSLEMNSLQIPITINRDKAANLNVDIATVARTIQTYLSGLTVSHYDQGGEDYDIILQSDLAFRSDIHNLDKVIIKNKDGKQVPLSSLISYDAEIGPRVLPHYNRMRAAYLTANLEPGYTVGSAVASLEARVPNLLPSNAKFEWSGDTQSYLDSSNQMMITLALALVFIYLVLAAQFESFVDPFIILLTVPFSILGAVLALRLTGGTNNIYTQIGFVTLIGLVSKHGILITEFANQLREQGLDKVEAVIQGAMLRIRPILMTTAAMVMGAIPLAMSSGAGAAARTQIGVVIIGGMLIGTFFSLFVVPFTYAILSRPRKKEA